MMPEPDLDRPLIGMRVRFIQGLGHPGEMGHTEVANGPDYEQTHGVAVTGKAGHHREDRHLALVDDARTGNPEIGDPQRNGDRDAPSDSNPAGRFTEAAH